MSQIFDDPFSSEATDTWDRLKDMYKRGDTLWPSFSNGKILSVKEWMKAIVPFLMAELPF